MGQPREALANLAAARPGLHTFGSVTEQFEADLELARGLRLTGRPRAALAAVEQALGQSDALRLQTANPEFRAQLQTPLRPAYDLKLELLRAQYEHALAAGRKAEAKTLAAAAFVAADASRAHSFADVAAQNYSPAVRWALASEFRRREELYRELSARRFALDARLDRSGPNDPRARHLMADIAEFQRQVDTINTFIARRTTTNGAPGRTASSRVSLPSLPADTALVSYWLGSEFAYAWVVLPTEIRWVRLSSPAAIAERAAAFHRSLARLVDIPVERRLEHARALYQMIIQPLEPSVSGVRQWVIVPDGALDYIPFAALQAPEPLAGSFVAARHDVALTPAAWMLETSRGQQTLHAHRGLLLVADPVYEERTTPGWRRSRLRWQPRNLQPGARGTQPAPSFGGFRSLPRRQPGFQRSSPLRKWISSSDWTPSASSSSRATGQHTGSSTLRRTASWMRRFPSYPPWFSAPTMPGDSSSTVQCA